MTPLSAYLLLAAMLFAVGLAGALTRRNAIIVLIGIELMLNAANLNFIAFWRFSEHPEALTGIYQWRDVARERTFLRFTFCGRAGDVLPGRSLDEGIARTLWMTRGEIAASEARHRSPWVLTCVDDYLAGRRLPLDLIRTL